MYYKISLRLVFLTICAIKVIDGYPNEGFVLMEDQRQPQPQRLVQMIPAQLYNQRHSYNQEPQQRFYIVPYSSVKSASDESPSHDSESEENQLDGHSGGGHPSRCPFAKHHQQSQYNEPESHSDSPHIREQVNGYQIDWIENRDGYDY